jgi:hypothetical protein
MRTLQEISKDLAEATASATMELDAVPYKNRAAAQTVIIQATEKLPKLLEEIKEVVVPNRLVGLFATGDTESTVRTALFLESNGGVVVDASKIYDDIADLIEPSYSKERIFCTTQYSLLIQGVRALASELGYLEVESPPFKETICKTREDTINHVRTTLRECGVGDMANRDMLSKQIIDTIVRDSVDSKQIPVLIVETSSVEERNAIAALFARSVDYKFAPGFVPTAAKVVSLFKATKQETDDDKAETSD